MLGTPEEELTGDTQLTSLGMPSLLAMQAASRIQDELATDFSIGDLFRVKTISDLVNLILSKTEGKNMPPRITRVAKRTVPRGLKVEEDCEVAPASFSQERIYLEDIQKPELAVYQRATLIVSNF